MNPQYEILAKCLLPTHMLEWFELTNVEVKPKEKTATQDTESDESPVNVIHLYLDENELRPDNREDLHPNGFTPAKTFHDFPIRGQEVLLHVRRRRWLDLMAMWPAAMLEIMVAMNSGEIHLPVGSSIILRVSRYWTSKPPIPEPT